jgi:hypothetical protein
MVRDYWEWVNSGGNGGGQYWNYAHSGNEDLTYNCFGYAFGISTWIQDPTYILQDDYVSDWPVPLSVVPVNYSGPPPAPPGGFSHIIRTDEICTNTDPMPHTVSCTSEKNRASRVQDI